MSDMRSGSSLDSLTSIVSPYRWPVTIDRTVASLKGITTVLSQLLAHGDWIVSDRGSANLGICNLAGRQGSLPRLERSAR
jgi:hypothetical protein